MRNELRKRAMDEADEADEAARREQAAARIRRGRILEIRAENVDRTTALI
jgi:hypothetical protein|nr:hypothetical protein [Paraburkholderia sp. BL8N3]